MRRKQRRKQMRKQRRNPEKIHGGGGQQEIKKRLYPRPNKTRITKTM